MKGFFFLEGTHLFTAPWLWEQRSFLPWGNWKKVVPSRPAVPMGRLSGEGGTPWLLLSRLFPLGAQELSVSRCWPSLKTIGFMGFLRVSLVIYGIYLGFVGWNYHLRKFVELVTFNGFDPMGWNSPKLTIVWEIWFGELVPSISSKS